MTGKPVVSSCTFHTLPRFIYLVNDNIVKITVVKEKFYISKMLSNLSK